MTQSGPRFQLLFQLTLAPSLSLYLLVSSFSGFAFIRHPITPLYNGSFLFPIYWFMFNYSLPGFSPMPLSFDTEHEEAPPQLPPPQNSSNVPNQPKQLCFVCRHLGPRWRLPNVPIFWVSINHRPWVQLSNVRPPRHWLPQVQMETPQLWAPKVSNYFKMLSFEMGLCWFLFFIWWWLLV